MYTNEFANEIALSLGKTEKDLPQATEGIAQLLLKDPTNYLLFGAYWWAVKKMLKKYTNYKEWFTGDYMDEITLNRAWNKTELATMSASLYYQQEQIMRTPSHYVLIDGEEQSYTLYDNDAGF